MFVIVFLCLLTDPFCILPMPGDGPVESAVRSNPWIVLPPASAKPATKTIQVVKVPGYWEQPMCQHCQPKWIPPVMEVIRVRADLDPIDERALRRYHWALSAGSCGMVGCFTHGAQRVLVDDQGNLAPPGARAAEAEGTDASRAEAGSVSQGWYLGKRIKGRWGR
jgi:hypothetical protein